MLVLKFGGTSVGSARRIRDVTEIVRAASAKEPCAVVVSAHSGVTDLLLATAEKARRGEVALEPLRAREAEILAELGLPADLVAGDLAEVETLLRGMALLREATPRSKDAVVSYGERMSAKIVAAAMTASGLRARAYAAWEAGLQTDDAFGQARPLPESAQRIRDTLLPIGKELPVITGFLGATRNGEVTTLGRGGSDYSGALFGAALRAREIQIWTDVDGVLTADPRLCADAHILEELSYDEAAELAFFGAKVLHPKTMEPAVELGIPIRVLNTMRPEGRGTVITGRAVAREGVVKCIACRRKVTVLHVSSSRMLGAPGFIRRLGELFDRHGVSIDMMATSEVSVSLTVDEGAALDALVAELGTFAKVERMPRTAIVCVVGEGMRETPGLAARVFGALGRAGVNVLMVSQGASRLNLGIVVRDEEADTAVRTLHGELFGRTGGGASKAT